MSLITRDRKGSINLGWIEYWMHGLIFLFLIAFSLKTIPDLTPWQREALLCFEYFSILAFTSEFLVRLWFSRPRWSYLFSFFGMVDAIAIIPFYLGLFFALGIDLLPIRALCLLKLGRIYGRSLRIFKRAFFIIKNELILFASTMFILLFLSAVGIYYFEHQAQPEAFTSVFESLWWAIVTLTTVGYGDVVPITTGGRIFTFFVLLIGLGTIAAPSGLLASALSKARHDQEEIHRGGT